MSPFRLFLIEASNWLLIGIGLSLVLAFPISFINLVRDHIKNNKKHE